MGDNDTPSKRPRLDNIHTSSTSPSPIRVKNNTMDESAMVLYNHGQSTLAMVKKSPPSMEELVSSPAMILTIGPERSQTTIQASLFRGISEPLHQLLNSPAAVSGDLAEINENLQHDDKAAFVQLTKMAYSIIAKGQGGAHTTLAGKSTVATTGSHTCLVKSPKCPDCKEHKMQLVFTCLNCNSAEAREGIIGLKSFFEVQFPHFVDATLLSPGQAGSKAGFASLDTKDPSTGNPYKLIHFAKMFSLASKYEVADLKFSSFKAFQRRLKKISNQELHGEQVDIIGEVVDALKYLAYIAPNFLHSYAPAVNNATLSGAEATIEGSSMGMRIEASDLLASLMRYVVIHIDCLLQDDEFREFVAENGVIGLVLMDVLRQSMVASEP